MLQELSNNTGAELVGIASMLFFLLIFAGVTLRVLTRKAGSYDHAAHLPLDEGEAMGDLRDESSTGAR